MNTIDNSITPKIGHDCIDLGCKPMDYEKVGDSLPNTKNSEEIHSCWEECNHKSHEKESLLKDECEKAHGQGILDARNVPMGISQWMAHGKKYGYWKYFIEKECEKKRPCDSGCYHTGPMNGHEISRSGDASTRK